MNLVNILIDSEETFNTETHADKAETETNHVETETDNAQTGTSNTASDNESYAYRMKLRSHRKRALSLTCVNETSLETGFYKYYKFGRFGFKVCNLFVFLLV